MNDWKLNARTVVKLKREHRTFVFLFTCAFMHIWMVGEDRVRVIMLKTAKDD